MPDSFEALAVIFFAVLPGALFVYAMERQVGQWGAKQTDRILRVITYSLPLYVIILPYGYILYRSYILSGELTAKGQFPWHHWALMALHWLALLAWFGAVPWVLGTIFGRRIDKGSETVAKLFGHHMEPPRAYDYLFNDAAGYVRMLVLLPDRASWVGGCFTDEGGGRRAYVAGYPEEPDIYLPIRLRCDAEGRFLTDTQGNLIADNTGVLVSGAKIAYLEFIDG